MGKKNAFVITIGFNKNAPAHVQALYHMRLLKENEGLKWVEKAEVR